MKRISLLLCLLVGCDKMAAPDPTIRVEREETQAGTAAVVYYEHHYTSQNRTGCYARFDTPEQVSNYKKQLEFLLTQLEEIETRMQVHEPEPPQ